MVEKVNKVLTPKLNINELKPALKETGYIEELNNFSECNRRLNYFYNFQQNLPHEKDSFYSLQLPVHVFH